MRKQVYELSVSDLERYPVWEFALDEEGEEGQDEATVRPYVFQKAVDPADGMFLLRARFVLADGTKMHGYLTAQAHGENDLGKIQPVVVTAHTQVGFWYGSIKPSDKEIRSSYAALDREAPNVFPLQYESDVPLVDGPVKGSIPGFLHLEDWRSGKVGVIA